MTLSIPWISLGYVYDSSGDVVEGVTVTITGDSPTTDDTDSSGRYMANLMDYASSGGTISLSCDGKGETTTDSFTLVLSDPGKQTDLTLQEAILSNDISLNTHHNYGNELYIFNSYVEDGHLKTSDY